MNALIFRSDDDIEFEVRNYPLMQSLTVEDKRAVIVSAPLRVNGKWFIPAPNPSELEHRWGRREVKPLLQRVSNNEGDKSAGKSRRSVY